MARSDSEALLLRQSRFITFDGGFESLNMLQRPDRYRHLEADFGRAKRIARGAGLSYAAASFGCESIVQQMSAFNRLLAFDPHRLTLHVEAGAAIGLLAFWAARRQLSVPILPGYPSITVGGCIAANVHGKNPLRDGTFSNWVKAMTLYHPAYGSRTLDRETHSEEFEATCGGYGLTGLIVDVTLRLVKQGGASVVVRHVIVGSIAEAIEAIAYSSGDHDFAYSWHDGTLRRRAFGQGILFLGSWAKESPGNQCPKYRPMTAAQRAKWPFSIWNSTTGWLANAYFRDSAMRHPVQVMSPFEASFPFARQTLYHRFYGRPGLAEVQVLVPDPARDAFIRGLSNMVERIDPPLMMISVKRFRARSRSLGMSGEGSLIALDLVRSGRTAYFLNDFDSLVLETGAQPNVAKDSRLPQRVAAGTLPGYESFRQGLRTYDPDRLYESELSRRLEL
jgi:decaprenylphospho-beta-D-ribofuranose 2-oxidase